MILYANVRHFSIIIIWKPADTHVSDAKKLRRALHSMLYNKSQRLTGRLPDYYHLAILMDGFTGRENM
jgi:hypothetical protein